MRSLAHEVDPRRAGCRLREGLRNASRQHRSPTPDHGARDGSPKLTGRSSAYSRNIARDVGNPTSAIIARISNHSEKFAASLATTLSDRCGSAVAQ